MEWSGTIRQEKRNIFFVPYLTRPHSLRHTFTTRMCEAGVNVKVIQDALGHKDVSTTLNIYTDVTKELRKSEFEGLELQFNQ
nr:tyrosine-type recombinase/integrase [Enterocloster clostridioformis]